DEARAEIVRLYADFLNGESGQDDVSKIFDTTDFGYREIRVERPLRLNFQVSEERLARLHNEKAFQKLKDNEQQAVLDALAQLPDRIFINRDAFTDELTDALASLDFKIGAPLKKAILSALSERDEDADICTDSKDKPEPDTDLRDHELVPLGEDWREYMKREVLPFVSDAWVDESHMDLRDKQVGRVGYEINFNRYFYEYVPPRPLEEIDSELKALEVEIAGLLKEVAA
ncbi:SAM-dependent DNA methyltransferase, partial [Cobetia sp. Dlab-2-U]|nr:SAM-dependent DNA methyltransferase [Cobetia sp. Dlab-2-U]